MSGGPYGSDRLGCLVRWIWFILDTETEYERGPLVMSEDYQLKYVGIVATIIGAAVLLLGFVGLIVNLS